MIVWFPRIQNQVIYSNGDELIGGKFKGVKASSTAISGDLSAISDSRRPESSIDLSKTPWISSSEKSNQWIEISLDNKPIRSIGIYWFTNNHEVFLPSKWTVEYKKEGKWIPFEIYVTDQYGINPDQYNIVHPAANLVCDAIRINIVSKEQKSVGILDIDVTFETN